MLIVDFLGFLVAMNRSKDEWAPVETVRNLVLSTLIGVNLLLGHPSDLVSTYPKFALSVTARN